MVMQESPPNVAFRRDLIGPRLASWNALLERLAVVQLSQGHDEFRWNLNRNGIFFVDSMYRALVQPEIQVDNNYKIWKMRIPLKIKVFLYGIFKKVSF